MKPFIHLIFVAFATALLGACTGNTGEDSERNVLEAQQQALERARDVEQDVAAAARRQAEQIERPGDGG